MEIGKYNILKVSRHTDFGVYLVDDECHEVLLPSRYITAPLAEGDEVEVFVYNDSEDRPVATTEKPRATVGQFAFLSVKAVNKIGAFLDWGLLKDLLVPFSQQKERMRQGNSYLVYIYLDDASKRIAATAKINQYIGNVYPDYHPGDAVEALVYGRNDLGYLCIVDNKHRGLVYDSELFRNLEVGDRLKAYVKNVRDDGKIDLTLNAPAGERTAVLAEAVINFLRINGGSMEMGDKSSPDLIRYRFHCSKKDFKKAIGLLLKEHKIAKDGDGYALLTEK